MWLASLCLFTTPLARRCSRTLQEILWGKKQVLFSWGKNDQSCSFVCLNCFAHIVRSSPPFASKSSSMVSRNMRNEKQRWPCSGNVWRRPSQRTRKWAWRLWKSSCWKRSGWDISMGVGGGGGGRGAWKSQDLWAWRLWKSACWKRSGWDISMGVGGGRGEGGRGGLGSHKICGHEGCGRVHGGKEACETLAWGLGEGGLEVTRFVGMKAVEDFMLEKKCVRH